MPTTPRPPLGEVRRLAQRLAGLNKTTRAALAPVATMEVDAAMAELRREIIRLIDSKARMSAELRDTILQFARTYGLQVRGEEVLGRRYNLRITKVVDDALYEAGKVDGLGPIQYMRRAITEKLQQDGFLPKEETD